MEFSNVIGICKIQRNRVTTLQKCNNDYATVVYQYTILLNDLLMHALNYVR